MNRRILTIGAAAFLLTALLGASTAVLFRGSTVAAQDAPEERVTRRKPVVYPRFELEVLVDGSPLREYQSRGRTFVEAVQGAEYELRLRNSSPDRVAVALSVDGLNTIDAQQNPAWNASKWVIEPYETITIGGWQMSSERARRFYFTNERDSYAAKLGQAANLGVISAVFFREHRRPITIVEPRPIQKEDSDRSSANAPEASATARVGTLRDERAATGIGRSVRHDVRTVDMDLDSRPVAELTIRYDYRYLSRGRFCPEPQ